MRECDGTALVKIGKISSDTAEACSAIDFSNSSINLGKPQGAVTKTVWQFSETSGMKKLEALLKDSGNNYSISEPKKLFLSAFDNTSRLSDFIVKREGRTNLRIAHENNADVLQQDTASYEVVYVSTTDGDLWVIEEYPRYLYSVDEQLVKLGILNDTIYLFTYNETTTTGQVYRHDIQPVLLFDFDSPLSETVCVRCFNGSLYIGLLNGELWRFDGFSFSLQKSFDRSINSFYSDEEYLYIGLGISDNQDGAELYIQGIVMFNGYDFYTVGGIKL
jgi:hypothetical protein